MFNDIQTFMAEAGEAGCYALCLVQVAEEYLQRKNPNFRIDVVEALMTGIGKNCILYNWKDRNDNDNFYVNYPETFLYYLTGKHWKVTKEGPDYIQKSDREFIINRWERVKAGAICGHFDRDNFHPVKDSLTIKYGQIKSKRRCTVNE